MAFFSIIIATRNRPELLARAVHSVLAQDLDDYEIVVVDDGSDAPLDLAQLNVAPQEASRIRVVTLDFQNRGRGPGYARNVGVWASRGEYCAFLDDDDEWIRDDHLSMARRALTAHGGAGLYFTNQEAVSAESSEALLLWLYPLAEQLSAAQRTLREGCYEVTVEDLIACKGFSHFNTTIIDRALFDQIQGVDEYVGYEEDLDFYLRAIDRAGSILYCPAIIGRHHIPDQRKRVNASTAIDRNQRLNIRLYLLEKNRLAARHSAIVQHCRRYSLTTLKQMVEALVSEGRYRHARSLALRALASGFSLKWAGYCVYLTAKSWFSRGEDHA